MKAWLLDSLGGLSKLHLADAPNPTPGADDVLLRVHYAALNPADRYLSEGQYPARPTFPHILGRDGMGTVEATGEKVSEWKVGDRVMVLRGPVGVDRPGTFAELAAVPGDTLLHVPDCWSEEQAASATLVYLTAFQALTQWSDFTQPGVVLVSGASGGVGVATIQLGSAMGHTMIGLSRSPEKGKRLLELGATAVFDPQDSQWKRRLRDALVNRKVDLAIDNIGGPLFNDIIDTMADRGRISVVGRLAGPVPSFNTSALLFRRLRIGGVVVSAYGPTDGRAAWQVVLQLLNKRDARPLIDHVYPFDRLLEAFDRLAAGPMGKVVLKVK